MSIENMAGIEKVSAALDRLQETYKRQAKIIEQAAIDSFALDLTREEALKVLAARADAIKAELGELGFSKPVIKIPLRGSQDERQNETAPGFRQSEGQESQSSLGRAQPPVA